MSLEDEIKAMFVNSDIEQEETDEQDPSSSTGSEELGEEESQTEEVEREEGEDSTDSDGDETEQEEVGESEEEETVEQRHSRLLAELNAANAQLLEYQARERTTQKPAAEVVEQPVSKPLSTESQAFSVDKALVEKAIVEGDAEAFLSIMKQMAEHIEAVSEAKRSSILTSVPEMATSMAMQKIEQMNAVNAFYAENPDLVDHRATVGMIANRIVSQNPQFSLKEVFEATEKETRKHLGIKKKLAAGSATEGRNFVKSAGARKPGKKQLTGMKAEIAAMNAARR